MKIQPNDPASPLMPSHSDPGSILHTVYQGLTKREYFAAMFLQSYLTGNSEALYNSKEMKATAVYAVLTADALIEALNKEEQ